MPSAISKISQPRLDQALEDIRNHISDGEHWPAAMKRLSSIKDYAMGETRLCSAEAALKNCEQIKGYFLPSAPTAALENIDRIMEEIQQLQREDGPDFLKLLFNPLIIAAVITAALYFFLLR